MKKLLVVVSFLSYSAFVNAQSLVGTIAGEASGDQSGYSVSMPDANTVAIGARSNDENGSNSGHVRIYSWDGSSWTQKGLDINGEASEDVSGSSVSMPDANTVAIGALNNDGNGSNSGHVRIYSWDGSSWTKKGQDIDGENSFDQSGFSISMPDANTVAIGAPYSATEAIQVMSESILGTAAAGRRKDKILTGKILLINQDFPSACPITIP